MVKSGVLSLFQFVLLHEHLMLRFLLLLLLTTCTVVRSEDHDDAGLSLDTSLETGHDQGSKHEQSETSGDVMKDLDDFLND